MRIDTLVYKLFTDFKKNYKNYFILFFYLNPLFSLLIRNFLQNFRYFEQNLKKCE